MKVRPHLAPPFGWNGVGPSASGRCRTRLYWGPRLTTSKLFPVVETVQIAARRRKLTAILDADVAGFSRLMGEDESGTHQALSEVRRAVDPRITDHGGRTVGNPAGRL